MAASIAMLAIAALPASAQAVPEHFYGVVNQGQFSAEDFERMEEAGVGTLRVQLGWPTVQAEEGRCQAGAQTGVCDWRFYDQVAGYAAQHGVQLFPYMLNTASFISADPDVPPVRSKRAKQGWTGFAKAAAKRYGPGGTYWKSVFPIDHPGAEPAPIEHWQIWNEPSAQPFWHPKPKPREYAKLVKITSKALRSVDPGAYIVLAGLFGTPTVGINQPDFIRAVYKTPKIERFFDAVGVHPYGPDIARVKFQLEWAREAIRDAGDRKADIWISEIGWASDRVHNQLGVGKRGQAKMLTKSFSLFRRKRSKWNIAGVNWYAWKDSDHEGLCDFCHRSGLVNLEGQPKLSYDAFRAEATR